MGDNKRIRGDNIYMGDNKGDILLCGIIYNEEF
jgi:hypothetical protein